MRINKINTPTCNFGYISHSAIDKVRYNSEGYEAVQYYNAAIMSERYLLSDKFNMMTEKQLERFEKIAKRAAVLRKSVIQRSTEYPDYTNKYTQRDIGLEVVTAYSPKNKVKIFPLPKEKTGDADYNLDILEEAVKYAEEQEKAPESDSTIDLYGMNERIGKVYPASVRQIDRFKSKYGNELLRSIYKYGFNFYNGSNL